MARDPLVEVVATLVEEVALLRDQITLLNETLGERSLTVRQMQELNGGKPSDDTFRRRVDAGLLPAVSERPIRVLFSEFKRAQKAGVL